MKHHVKTKKLGRVKKQREALMRSLALSLIEHGRITTTEAKAKALRPVIEKFVTQARTGTLASRRLLLSRLNSNTELVSKLIDDYAARYKERPGGYTRIVKLPPRAGDASPMAVIEFV